MNISRNISCFLLSIVAVLMAMSCSHGSNADVEEIDSLNALSASTKYISIDESRSYVNQIYTKYSSSSYEDGLMEARINEGNIHGMAMDYDSARICYKDVLQKSDNDLLCMAADVGMMSVCLMMSQSKDFYDYRNDAVERMKDVENEVSEMSPHQMKMWDVTRSEFHFVSMNYFIKMRQSEGVSQEMQWLDDNQDVVSSDSTQLFTYMFMTAINTMIGDSTEEIIEEKQRNLMRVLRMATEKGYIYYEAMAATSLARSIVQDGELRPSRQAYVAEILEMPNDSNFSLALADKAVSLAEKYGNMFVQSAALVTKSDYYTSNHQYEKSLQCLDSALQLVNKHHKMANRSTNHEGCSDDDVLYAYTSNPDSVSTEMRWIADDDIVAVPEWVARVREELSVVYGAMGYKAESDYNHNIYFDILDVSRQDQKVVQEKERLNQEEQILNVLLLVLVLIIIGLAWFLIVYNRKINREYRKKLSRLSKVINICRSMSTVLADDVEDEDMLIQRLHEITDAEINTLFPSLSHTDWTECDPSVVKGLDQELLNVLLVFFKWIKERGCQYINYTEEVRKIDSDTYIFEKRFEENKRLYMDKLTSMSIVDGITPFLDRAVREVMKLTSEQPLLSTSAETEVKERLQYIRELIDKINAYNDVLGHWVKIRKGLVNLNVENFEIRPLLETLRKGEKSFMIKGVTLKIDGADSVVKADKSMTLFMMNTLLDNARKYTPEGGSVTLSATEGDDYVEISVSDTGHGMSEADVDVLNNSKVYDSSKIGVEGEHADDIRSNKGFGFGLMNCKGIIEKYRKTNSFFNVCRFGVESKVGEGSRFFFRLPKGVMKVMSMLLLLLSFASCGEKQHSPVSLEKASEVQIIDDALMNKAYMFSDSVYNSNVNGEYASAVCYADSVIKYINEYYLKQCPGGDKLMVLEGAAMNEVTLLKDGFKADYNLMIELRNEVAIAALSLNRPRLYRYNKEAFSMLYILSSTDESLAEYCKDIRMANNNKKTILICLVLIVIIVIGVYFFLTYRNNQLIIFNMRQFLQMNKRLFSSEEQKLHFVLKENLDDIKQLQSIALMIITHDSAKPNFYFHGDESERDAHEGLLRATLNEKKPFVGANGHFRTYPLLVPGSESNEQIGAIGIWFKDDKLSDEEELIMQLTAQFVSINLYFSYFKIGEHDEILELKNDERRKIDTEQQRIHVQNMIMDNCMSALKHETMYYPNRIKQLADSGDNVKDICELLTYYKEIFTILSTCAAKQVERVLFKRTTMSVDSIAEMLRKSFVRQTRKLRTRNNLNINIQHPAEVVGDKVFLQILLDNVLSLYFEHASGGDLTMECEEADGFVRFIFTDASYRYSEDEIPNLFYADNLKYDPANDRLAGTQFLIAKQVIRQHDAYSRKRGCRIYVENTEDGTGSRFIFTLCKGA